MVEYVYRVWDSEPVAAGFWWGGADSCCVGAYRSKGAASYAASLVNLANPGTYDLNPVVAPSWAAPTGWTFTGTEYFDTGYEPTPNGTYIAQFADMAGGATLTLCGAEIEAVDPWRRVALSNHATTKAYFANGSQEAAAAGSHITTGNYAVADIDCFIDGTYNRTISYDLPDWSSSESTVFVGAHSFAGVPFWFMLGKIEAFAMYSCKLTPGEIADVWAAMASF